MIRLFLILILWGMTAFHAVAQCTGSDLRLDLSVEERRELQAQVAGTVFASGNHWKATRGAHTIHVIGTIHVADPRMDDLMTRLTPLIASADRVFVEMTQADQTVLKREIATRPDLIFLTDGPTLTDLLPEEDWRPLAKAARDRGIPPFMAAKFKPWYLSTMLAIPPCTMRHMQSGALGLDNRIIQAAKQANVPQRSLEPYDTIFTLMGREPLEAQIEFLTLGVPPDDLAADSIVTALAGFFEEKPAEVIAFSRIFARRFVDLPPAEIDAQMDNMLNLLVKQRNLAWMQTLETVPDGTTIVAAGAGHLPGMFGILNLLKSAGFTMERQPF